MEHTPYGYDIVNGKPVVNKKQAAVVREVYAAYLRGLSMKEAGKAAGIDVTHSVIKKMLFNRRYLGTRSIRGSSTMILSMPWRLNSAAGLNTSAGTTGRRKRGWSL